MGRLVIEGEAIECLVLVKRNADPRLYLDDTIPLDHPEPSVVIPVGEYRVKEVRLQGGYHCYPFLDGIRDPETGESREVGWFRVSPDRPHVLHIGAPLKPTLRVFRENRNLRMAYHLADVSGQEFWWYVPENFGCGPVASFSVYRGDLLVGSGSLGPYG